MVGNVDGTNKSNSIKESKKTIWSCKGNALI